MGKKNREAETKLLEKIREYKKEFRQAFLQKHAQEAQERLLNDEEFFYGNWIPKSKAVELHSIFRKREKGALIETLILVLVCFLVNMAVLFVFVRILLP